MCQLEPKGGKMKLYAIFLADMHSVSAILHIMIENYYLVIYTI